MTMLLMLMMTMIITTLMLAFWKYLFVITFNMFYSFLMFLMSFFLKKGNMSFLMVVSSISFFILFYTFFYISLNKKVLNFVWTIAFFAFSMLLLISANSISTYLVGWDGLGASSFLLIMFYNNLFSYRSAFATFLTNRLGDVFIIMSFIFMANKESIYAYMHYFPLELNNITLSFWLLLMGAATKSAQMPFSAWLPAAMAAPTPVSALVHSSTLVTAGIYLLYRYSTHMDVLGIKVATMMSFLGIMLSFLAGLMAFFEVDIKKLVAMSTLSQLGLLVYILFQKQTSFAILHLMSHAFFKSLLFLIIGFLIVMNLGIQDMRSSQSNLGITNAMMIMMICSSLSLIGFSYTPGFFSKDLILTSFPSQGLNICAHSFLLFSCMLTILYTLKSIIILQNNMNLKQVGNFFVFDKNFLMPSLCLFFFMMNYGYFFFFSLVETESYIPSIFNKFMGMTLIIVSGVIMSYFFYMSKNKKIKIMTKMVKETFSHMVNMNWMSNVFMSAKAVKISNVMFLETAWLEMLIEKNTKNFLQSNKSQFSKKIITMTNMELILFFLFSMMAYAFISLNY